jgi:CHASE2 domain-containing sensor protein
MAGELQKPLPAPEVILIGLLAALVVLVQVLWQIVSPFETVVHESAHVLAGILTGRTILGVKINEPSGGSTDMVPKPRSTAEFLMPVLLFRPADK